jgi:hypothetical protein
MTGANSPSDQEESFREEPSAEKEPSKEPSADKVVGVWHITGMEMWGADYVNTETQAYIQIEKDGTGDFQFGLVTESIDGYVEEVDTEGLGRLRSPRRHLRPGRRRDARRRRAVRQPAAGHGRSAAILRQLE